MESLSSFIQSPLFSKFFAVIGAALSIAIFWWRAGSVHALLERLWRLVAGRTEAHDVVVKTILQESRDVERFNFTYRMKLGSIAAIHKLDKWRRAHDIGMSQLQQVRRWIDTDSTEMLRQPPRRYVAVHLVVALFALLSTVPTGWLATSHDAYLQMRASKVWFKTDGTTVKAPFENWSFDAGQCLLDRAGMIRMTQFNQSEADAVCNAFKDGELKQLTHKTLATQLRVGIFFLLAALTVGVSRFLAAGSAQKAITLRRRLSKAIAGEISAESTVPLANATEQKLARRGGREKRHLNDANTRRRPNREDGTGPIKRYSIPKAQ